MRKAVLSTAILQALLGFGPSAQAQHYGPAEPRGAVHGVGCYWFRAQHYCSRYCYLEVDGYYYCQRLRDAGSQAPPLVPSFRHRALRQAPRP